jgi:hypothetical protein
LLLDHVLHLVCVEFVHLVDGYLLGRVQLGTHVTAYVRQLHVARAQGGVLALWKQANLRALGNRCLVLLVRGQFALTWFRCGVLLLLGLRFCCFWIVAEGCSLLDLIFLLPLGSQGGILWCGTYYLTLLHCLQLF